MSYGYGYDYFYIFLAMLGVVVSASFLGWLLSWGLFNKRTCGHESDSYRYVVDERMWMCHECYSEYTYDRLGIGR